MFLNPIYQREIKVSVRDPKIILLVLAFLGILGMAIVFLWPSTGVYSQATASSMQVFAIFLMSNLALIILLVPALTSPSITSERENNSYSLLFTSLLTPGQILRGKLMSSITMILLVIVVSMPVSALCALSGGIGMALLIRAFSVILMAALTYGVMGLAVSAVCRSTFTALIVTYVMVAFFAGCTWLPYYLFRVEALIVPRLVIRCLSPFDALWSILYSGRYALTQETILFQNPNAFYYIHILGNGIILSICLAIFCKYVVSAPKPATIYRGIAGVVGFLLLLLLAGVGYFAKVVFGDPKAMTRAMGTDVLNPYLIMILGGLISLVMVMIIVKLLKKSSVAKTSDDDDNPQRTRSNPQTLKKRGMKLVTAMVGFVGGGFILWRVIQRVTRSPVPQAAGTTKTTWPLHYEIGGIIALGILLLILRWFLGSLLGAGGKHRPIGRFRNPVFVAEMRSKIFAKPVFLVYGLVTCISISMILLIITCLNFAEWLTPDKVRLTAIVFQVGVVAILAPSISSGSITDELTSRTFKMLRMTPIPATRVVLGKLKASFVYVSVFLVSSLPVLLSLVYLDYSSEMTISSFWRVGAWFAILVVTTVLFITAGFFASAFSKSTSVATAISYCFAAFICIVTLAALIPDALPAKIQTILLTINPVVAALRLMSDDLFGQLPDDVWIHNLGALGGTALFFIIASSIRTYRIFTRRS